MPDEYGKYTESEIQGMSYQQVESLGYGQVSDAGASSRLMARKQESMQILTDSSPYGSPYGSPSSSPSPQSSYSYDPSFDLAMAEVIRDIFVFLRRAIVFVAQKGWKLACFLGNKYWHMGDENRQGKEYVKAKVIKIVAPIAGGLLVYAAHGLNQKYHERVEQEQRVAEQKAIEAKRQAIELQEAARQKQLDQDKNTKLDQSEINPLNLPHAQDNLKRVFMDIQSLRLDHYVVVAFGSNKRNVPATKVLVPPAQKLAVASSLYVCTAHPFVISGERKIITQCSDFPFSSSKLGFTGSIKFLRPKDSFGKIVYGDHTSSMITRKLSKQDARHIETANF